MIWDTITWKSRYVLKDDFQWSCKLLVFFADSKTLVTAYASDIELWDVRTDIFRAKIDMHQLLDSDSESDDHIEAMTFFSNDQLLAMTNYIIVTLWCIEKKFKVQDHKVFFDEKLFFNTDESRLETSNNLTQISWSLHNATLDLVFTTSSYAIDVKKEWMTYRDYNVLKLSSNRRSLRSLVYAFYNKTLVLESETDKVTFFQFSSTIASSHI